MLYCSVKEDKRKPYTNINGLYLDATMSSLGMGQVMSVISSIKEEEPELYGKYLLLLSGRLGMGRSHLRRHGTSQVSY